MPRTFAALPCAAALCAAALFACGPSDAPTPVPPSPGTPVAQTPPAAPAPSPPPAPAPTAPSPSAPAPVPATPPLPSGTGGTSDAGAAADADEVFASRCVVCHGAEGRGDGLGSAALQPKPRNYHDGAWQASVSDEHIRATIVGGGASVGKSALMPAQPDLAAKPEVLAALVAKIRAFGKAR